ncbi:MAG TPA: DinB family protein [Anaerolineales bacterium]|nr:DinB family protein [Anaerolineales bacterium]
MKELIEYRTHLLKRLVVATKEFRDACLAADDAFAPLSEGEWNIHQTAAHTRDVNELVYGMRAKRTANEDNPEFQNFDADAHMAEHYDPNEPLHEMLDGFVKSVEALHNLLKSLPIEAWSRESRHVTFGGGFTLQTWVERNLAHIEEHLESIKK